MHLSLAMIVRNEAGNLRRCLDSAKGIVDEMVVLDTGSTDETHEIAMQAGAKVVQFKWTHDFSAARNASLRACSGDWILVLDADETLDEADRETIRLALADPQVQAYRLWMRDYMRSGAYMGCERALSRNDGRYREGSEYAHLDLTRRLRLFRAQPGDVYASRVHESAEAYFEERGLRVEELDASIHHFGKLDFERDITKQAEYLRLAKVDAAERPSDPSAHWNVLQEALLVEDWPAALSASESYLRLRDSAPALVYLGAAKALVALGRAQEALACFEPVLQKEPAHAPALSFNAEALAALQRYEEAENLFAQAMEAEPGFTYSFLKASKMKAAIGDAATARRVLEAGLDQNPSDLKLWEALVALSAANDRDAVAADAWNAILAVPDGGRGIWHQLVIHELLARGDKSGARHVLEMGLRTFPGHEELAALGRRME